MTTTQVKVLVATLISKNPNVDLTKYRTEIEDIKNMSGLHKYTVIDVSQHKIVFQTNKIIKEGHKDFGSRFKSSGKEHWCAGANKDKMFRWEEI